MSNLDLATTTQIMAERDYCQGMVSLFRRSFDEGLMTAYERAKQAAPYQDRLDQCVNRLIKDWAFAMEVAAQLT